MRRRSAWCCCPINARRTSAPNSSAPNQSRPLADNRSGIRPSRGRCVMARQLLGGLVVCGRCGYRLGVNYNGSGRFLRYVYWLRAKVCYGTPVCQSLSGCRLDEFVAAQVLLALQPAAPGVALGGGRRRGAPTSGTAPQLATATRTVPLRVSRSARLVSTNSWNRRTVWWPGSWSAPGTTRCRRRNVWSTSTKRSARRARQRYRSRNASRSGSWRRRYRNCGMRRSTTASDRRLPGAVTDRTDPGDDTRR